MKYEEKLKHEVNTWTNFHRGFPFVWGFPELEARSKEPELEKKKKASSKHSNLHKGAVSKLLLFQSPPLWALNVLLLSFQLNVLCSAENNWDGLNRTKKTPARLINYNLWVPDLGRWLDGSFQTAFKKKMNGSYKQNTVLLSNPPSLTWRNNCSCLLCKHVPPVWMSFALSSITTPRTLAHTKGLAPRCAHLGLFDHSLIWKD